MLAYQISDKRENLVAKAWHPVAAPRREPLPSWSPGTSRGIYLSA
eukprot:COSAG01_NODE_2675_length_7264_cov_29.639358_6_plen_45_part_00